jgi:excisionase family DNA binding protein
MHFSLKAQPVSGDGSGNTAAALAPELPQVFNCATLAQYLEVDLKTVQALAQQGKIPCRKVGKAYRFFAPAVIKWLLGPHASSSGET